LVATAVTIVVVIDVIAIAGVLVVVVTAVVNRPQEVVERLSGDARSLSSRRRVRGLEVNPQVFTSLWSRAYRRLDSGGLGRARNCSLNFIVNGSTSPSHGAENSASAEGVGRHWTASVPPTSGGGPWRRIAAVVGSQRDDGRRRVFADQPAFIGFGQPRTGQEGEVLLVNRRGLRREAITTTSRAALATAATGDPLAWPIRNALGAVPFLVRLDSVVDRCVDHRKVEHRREPAGRPPAKVVSDAVAFYAVIGSAFARAAAANTVTSIGPHRRILFIAPAFSHSDKTNARRSISCRPYNGPLRVREQDCQTLL
jgi:hypothetical protein